jgi:PAS domain S-box-containing protein
LITAAGEVLPVSQVILSHKNDAGQVEFYSTVMRDISERRSSMLALTEAQERLQRALDGSSDGIWERDVRTDAFSTSDRLAEILGYTPDEMPRNRMAWRALNHPDDMPISDAAVARLVTTDESVVWDTRMRTGSGEYRWMRRRGRMVRDADGNPILTAGTLTDIHDAKMAEASLQELQARYQRALDGTNDGLWEIDQITGIFNCSARFCEIIGWAVDQGPRDRGDLRALTHPDDVEVHVAAVKAMHAKSAAHGWELRLRNSDGGYRWVRLRGIATRGEDGTLLLTSGTISDIHDAHLAEDELRRHRDNLAQLVEERTAGLEQARVDAEASREAAERANLAKSEFLANMSHELRTPMHAIISFANFGVDKSDRVERDKLLHYFRNIQKSGSRLLTLLNDLLDLSKLEAGKMDMAMAPVNVAALLGDAIAEAEAFAQNRSIHLVLDADPARLGVVWDGPRVLQVIRNLISNAVKFSIADGNVTISAHPVVLPAGRRAGDPQVPGIEIRVCDAGIGIPEDELETVFDKFVQSSKTKTGAGGTGLGLAICREIILAHQGSIRAENNPAPQPGATFVVLMPVSPSAARQSRDAASSQPQERVEEVK